MSGKNFLPSRAVRTFPAAFPGARSRRGWALGVAAFLTLYMGITLVLPSCRSTANYSPDLACRANRWAFSGMIGEFNIRHPDMLPPITPDNQAEVLARLLADPDVRTSFADRLPAGEDLSFFTRCPSCQTPYLTAESPDGLEVFCQVHGASRD